MVHHLPAYRLQGTAPCLYAGRRVGSCEESLVEGQEVGLFQLKPPLHPVRFLYAVLILDRARELNSC